jgi:LPS-assembly protein
LSDKEVLIVSASQEKEGSVYRLRGSVRLETTSMRLHADAVDYNEETGEAEARGNVHFLHLQRGEELFAARVEYNVNTESGRFFEVHGTSRPRIEARRGLLTTSNPFYFQGRWAERLQDRIVLHHGFVTNCRVPKPLWRLNGSQFDIIPNQRAIARHSVFRLAGVPLFYAPVFYKSLERMPRKSGFLTPNAGNSSRWGQMLGIGYFWAINRSYDLTYRPQYFTARGLAHNVDFRGKPREGTDFNLMIYGVNDRGLLLPNGDRRKEGGYLLNFEGRSDLGKGWRAVGEVNYLSSFRFRQAFTQSFNEAIYSEVHSSGALSRHWSSFSLDNAFERLENFQGTGETERVSIRKLPSIEFASRDRRIWRSLPIWFSLEASTALMRRSQQEFQTHQVMNRTDFSPRFATSFGWRGFHLTPSFRMRETSYAQRRAGTRVSDENIWRSAREFTVDLRTPTLARVFRRKTFLGDAVKHVIEPRISFRNVSGVGDFRDIIRFDAVELLSNTRQAEVAIVNRLYAKRNGVVDEVLSWEIRQQRYFDPSFGNAVLMDYRNVFLHTAELTPFAFVDRPRNYSPLVSQLRSSPLPWMGFEWRTDYDASRGHFTNSSIRAEARWDQYAFSLGHNQVRSVPLEQLSPGRYQGLSPSANQMIAAFTAGNENRRGWNLGANWIYDFRRDIMQYISTQISYNTDCCGISVQFRRFSFGTRNENQVRVAFALANIGSFGTLRKQERLF